MESFVIILLSFLPLQKFFLKKIRSNLQKYSPTSEACSHVSEFEVILENLLMQGGNPYNLILSESV